MIKGGVDISDIDKGFIRNSVVNNIRLDGRQPKDFNSASISITRNESSCSAEVLLGSTRAVTVIKGAIVQPYPDRPTEGILQINVDVSLFSHLNGVSHTSLSRFIERSIRDSDALDAESLCVTAGERVWMITCDVQLLDYHGGAIDACMLSSSAALRAYRRPDVSIEEGGLLRYYSSDEREPLPLALHHTPLSVSIGVFKLNSSDVLNSTQYLNKIILMVDLTASEEKACDGIISFSINGHRELCAIHKPGGVPLDITTIVQATECASIRASQLHLLLQQSLQELEITVTAERQKRLEILRLIQQDQIQKNLLLNNNTNTSSSGSNIGGRYEKDIGSGRGIDRNDSILQWSQLHQPSTDILQQQHAGR